MSTPERGAVYRAYDQSGTLLYVGFTAAPGARLAAHHRDSAWWSFVSRIDVQMFATADAARAAEATAIVTEHPSYNASRPTAPRVARLHHIAQTSEADAASYLAGEVERLRRLAERQEVELIRHRAERSRAAADRADLEAELQCARAHVRRLYDLVPTQTAVGRAAP